MISCKQQLGYSQALFISPIWAISVERRNVEERLCTNSTAAIRSAQIGVAYKAQIVFRMTCKTFISMALHRMLEPLRLKQQVPFKSMLWSAI